MLRLTLRTLLAYLDDTLPPDQAKDIGQKVAESEVAQKTVDRIKTVTRRRRLTAPAVDTEDNSTDPNTIAEYLDNTLPSEQLAEVEQSALDNDTKLAEVAACHQILTLVLGEPAKVPPTARARMYGLVAGPESIPGRKPAGSTAIAGVAEPEAVDEYENGEDQLLETFLGPRKVLWALTLTLLVLFLILAILAAIPPAPAPSQGFPQIAPASVKPADPPKPVEKPKAAPEKDTKEPTKPEVPPKPEGKKVEEPPIVREKGPQPRLIDDPTVPIPPVQAPDSERRPVATLEVPGNPLLVRRRDTSRWERLNPAEPRVASTDSVLALPGFHCELKADTGAKIVLWGVAPDTLPVPLAETHTAFYVPPQGLDIDLTLHGGRVYVSSGHNLRSTRVRVRFLEETWDIVLADDTSEVAIDRYAEPLRGSLFAELAESPRTVVTVGVIRGSASVRNGSRASPPLAAGNRWTWDSKVGLAALAPKDDKFDEALYRREPPATPAGKETTAALTEMARRVALGQGRYELDFDATIKDPKESMSRRVMSAWMLAAVGGGGYLIDNLEIDGAMIRDAVARALCHWYAQSPSRDEELAALLAEKSSFTEAQRDTIQSLVRGLPNRPAGAETADRLFDQLRSEKLAIRELARMHLAKIDPAAARESAFDAASDRRDMQITTWQRAFRKGKGKG